MEKIANNGLGISRASHLCLSTEPWPTDSTRLLVISLHTQPGVPESLCQRPESCSQWAGTRLPSWQESLPTHRAATNTLSYLLAQLLFLTPAGTETQNVTG